MDVDKKNQPQFPLYIVSKGRWELRHTVKELEWMNVPYHIIVEEPEYDKYAAVINPDNILVLPQKYKENYDVFNKNLGNKEVTGSGPARNYAWDHSIKQGFEWHWVMDDNIRYFKRLNKNTYYKVKSGIFFKWMEDFVLRYTNIAMAGPNYYMFVPISQKKKPFTLNTRIYSCNLIKNDIPYRWRCRYNEDTDLSLRILKDGWCTILFNAFVQNKLTTLSTKGGNTTELYKNGQYKLAKSQMLIEAHPDLCELKWRYNRPHHYCDYSVFKQTPIKKRG